MGKRIFGPSWIILFGSLYIIAYSAEGTLREGSPLLKISPSKAALVYFLVFDAPAPFLFNLIYEVLVYYFHWQAPPVFGTCPLTAPSKSILPFFFKKLKEFSKEATAQNLWLLKPQLTDNAFRKRNTLRYVEIYSTNFEVFLTRSSFP